MAHINNQGKIEKYMEYFGKSMEIFMKITHDKLKFE